MVQQEIGSNGGFEFEIEHNDTRGIGAMRVLIHDPEVRLLILIVSRSARLCPSVVSMDYV